MDGRHWCPVESRCVPDSYCNCVGECPDDEAEELVKDVKELLEKPITSPVTGEVRKKDKRPKMISPEIRTKLIGE